MANWEATKKATELCAFVWPFRKGTNLWTAGFDWQPQGTTGDGRCHEACEPGAVDPLTRRFKHFMALAVHPQRGPRGKQATRMTCGIPSALVKEILAAVAERQKLGGKVVLRQAQRTWLWTSWATANLPAQSHEGRLQSSAMKDAYLQ